MYIAIHAPVLPRKRNLKEEVFMAHIPVITTATKDFVTQSQPNDIGFDTYACGIMPV